MSSEEFGAHSASKDPRKLFLPDPERKVTWLNDKALPLIGALTGYSAFAFLNHMCRMPLHAGVWRHVLAATAGIIGGAWWHRQREERMAEYDAMLRWYIDQHPEEFPAPERIKVGDMMKEWIPIR